MQYVLNRLFSFFLAVIQFVNSSSSISELTKYPAQDEVLKMARVRAAPYRCRRVRSRRCSNNEAALTVWRKSPKSGTTIEEVGTGSALKIYLELLPQGLLLQGIYMLLSPGELCTLCQVDRYHRGLLQDEDFWRLRAAKGEITKVVEDRSWKWNVIAAETKYLYARSLDEEPGPVRLRGDATIIDPFKVFFRHKDSAGRLKKLRAIVQQSRYKHRDFSIIYRGRRAIFITTDYEAFETSRNGTVLGYDELSSGIVAAIPKELIGFLVEENGSDLEGGVSFEGVNGKIESSGDGDFLIRRPDSCQTPQYGVVSKRIEDRRPLFADVLCVTGGSWTWSDDSSSSDDNSDDGMEGVD